VSTEKRKQDLLMSISATQCKAARAMLGWSRDHLAGAAKVAKRTIVDFERGTRQPYERTIRDLRAAFERGGVEFIGDDGVRLASGRLQDESAANRH
jgi:transcriptional regulator with XRE-family HTH domain